MSKDNNVWYCVDCQYESPYKCDMKNHIEAKHIDSTISCDICGVVTKTRKALKMHKYRQHKNMSKM